MVEPGNGKDAEPIIAQMGLLTDYGKIGTSYIPISPRYVILALFFKNAKIAE
ncbi:MAG: hypothetical protein V3V51_01160 [Desulfobacterales bacterium]|jgi:hypothetical protein|nr:hypothetical protein [Desulfobacterales bacterium]